MRSQQKRKHIRPKPDAATLRRLAVTFELDPRSILKELTSPGSVRGLPGERARRAVREYLSSTA